METMAAANGGGREREADQQLPKQQQQGQQQGGTCGHYFQMPVHYPRYRREEYEAMPEWQLDRLLADYGLPVAGNLHHKRAFAIGAFLWGNGAGNNH